MMVVDEIRSAMGASDRMRSPDSELAFERGNENLEAIEKQCLGLADDLRDFGTGQGTDHERTHAVRLALDVDLLHHLLRLFHRIHERQRDFVEAHGIELGEQAMAQHLGRDAGAVGYKKSRAFGVCHLGCVAAFR